MQHHITLITLLITFFTSCSTHKQTISREENSTIQLDSTLLLKSLLSYIDMQGEIYITPLLGHSASPSSLESGSLPIDPRFGTAYPSAASASSSQPSCVIPYKITFDIHASRRDTLEETAISSHRAESTNATEVEQLSTRDPNSSSWWLKFRFRAMLCILLLSAPFAVVGIYRVIRACKSK